MKRPSDPPKERKRGARVPRAGARAAAGELTAAVVAGELIAKAARLFGAKGYDKTSMGDIAAEFGILHGSRYHHFGSKEELFVAVYKAGAERMIGDVQRAIAPQFDPWDRLEAA